MLRADTPCSIVRHFKSAPFVRPRNSLCKDSDYIGAAVPEIACKKLHMISYRVAIGISKVLSEFASCGFAFT